MSGLVGDNESNSSRDKEFGEEYKYPNGLVIQNTDFIKKYY